MFRALPAVFRAACSLFWSTRGSSLPPVSSQNASQPQRKCIVMHSGVALGKGASCNHVYKACPCIHKFAVFMGIPPGNPVDMRVCLYARIAENRCSSPQLCSVLLSTFGGQLPFQRKLAGKNLELYAPLCCASLSFFVIVINSRFTGIIGYACLGETNKFLERLHAYGWIQFKYS